VNNLKLNKIQVLFILSWIFILIALIPSCHGDYTRSIDCDRDNWVSSYNSNTNYGGMGFLFVGDYIFGSAQAYYHFDISNADTGWIEIDIYLDFYQGSSTVNLGGGITSNNWVENTITWNNQPGNGTYIGYVLNTGVPFSIPVDADDFTNGEITITLYGRGGDSDGYIAGTTREGAWGNVDMPRVRFTYEGLDPIIIMGIIITLITISSIVGLVVFLVRRNKKKSAYRPIQPPLPATQIDPYRTGESKFCSECGSLIGPKKEFCTSCGAKLKY